MSNELTLERLKYLVSYDPDSGIFTGQKGINSRGRPIGGIECGSLAKRRSDKYYRVMSIDNVRYLSHRLAWLYSFGEFPKNEIDHIDGDSLNNKINNLRDVTRIENSQNIRKASSNNKTGYLGVFLHKETGKYRSTIMTNRKRVSLGLFTNPEEASIAYINAKRELHSSCNI